MQLIVVDSKSECYQEMPQSDFRPTHDNPLEHRFVCLFDLIFLCPSQQSFSYVGTCIPELNLARINVSCSRTQHSDAGEARTLGLESSTLPLSHCAPLEHWSLIICKFVQIIALCHNEPLQRLQNVSSSQKYKVPICVNMQLKLS